MMPEYTANYNLIKPGYDETADIADINENMDTIDAALKQNADASAAAETPTGAQAKADAAEAAANQYTDQKVGAVDQALAAHLAEKASSTILGHVKQGNGVTITDGVIAADVKSVAGKTGTVTLTKSDVDLGNVENYRQARSAQGYTIVKDGTDGTGIINFKTS